MLTFYISNSDSPFDLNVKQNGFTLIELLIASAIFVLISSTLISIVIDLSKAQKRGIIIQEMQENTRFAIEMMAREIRLTQKSSSSNDPGGICVPNGKNFNLIGESQLSLINYSGNCVTYKLGSGVEANAIIREIDIAPFDGVPEQSGKITTPSKVKILTFKFASDGAGNILGDAIGDNKQPKVVISFQAQATDFQNQQIYQIQTTVSQRELDVQ